MWVTVCMQKASVLARPRAQHPVVFPQCHVVVVSGFLQHYLELSCQKH